jgi:hypothetical protein
MQLSELKVGRLASRAQQSVSRVTEEFIALALKYFRPPTESKRAPI